MKFLKTNGWEKGIQALAARLQQELAQHNVLWLVCGGSNIRATVEVMQQIDDSASERLKIFLTDERYGEIGHSHSNARQLLDAGFDAKQAVFTQALIPGFSLAETQERYGQALQGAMEHADVIIAQFGIGADGHIAGILPHSPAAKADSWVTGYEAPPFVRVTMTFPAIRQVSAAYAMVFGEDKRDALTRLHAETVPLADQPSQILKELPEAYVFNDQIGDAA